MTTKIERSPSQLATPKAQGSSPTEATAPVESLARPSAPTTAYSGPAARPSLLPPAAHVARSADPNALWTPSAPRRNRLGEVAEFKRLPPAERQAKVAALRAEREALRGDIQDRVGQLDRKWTYSQLKKRTASLRDLQAKQPELTPDQHQRLDTALRTAEAAAQKVAVLAEKAKAFGPDSKTDPAQMAQRKQLASELRQARGEQSAAVREATAVIDEAGLKIDRLANAEQVLDKNAPPVGSGQSLLDKVIAFFDLEWVLSSFMNVLDGLRDSMDRAHEQREETKKEDREIDQQVRRQDERRQVEKRFEASRALQLKALA